MSLSITLFGFTPALPRNATQIINGLSVTVSPALTMSAFSGTPYGGLHPAFSYLGGESAILGSTFPKQSFIGTFNLSYSSGPRTGLGGVVAFKTDAQTFDVISYAGGFSS